MTEPNRSCTRDGGVQLPCVWLPHVTTTGVRWRGPINPRQTFHLAQEKYSGTTLRVGLRVTACVRPAYGIAPLSADHRAAACRLSSWIGA